MKFHRPFLILVMIILSTHVLACQPNIVTGTEPPAVSTEKPLEPDAEPTRTVSPSVGQSGEDPVPAHDLIRIDFNQFLGTTPDIYGSNGWWTDQDSVLWEDRHRDLGVRIMRLPVVQSIFEPVNDDTDPHHINKKGFLFNYPIPHEGKTITLMNWLSMLKNLNIAVMLNIPYIAGWNSRNGDNGSSSTYPPESIEEYEEYITALLEFVIYDAGFDPKKVILEPVNEPDLGCLQDAHVSCFWRDWQMDDLVDVLNSAVRAARRISPEIQVVGVSECCGTAIVDQLVSQYDGLDLLDGFTYHTYVSGSDFALGINPGLHLIPYGKPVFINEYGNINVWSDGLEGAFWHAQVLPQIFAAGIQPLQFPISHFPGSHQGYENLGLFKDWREGWTIKPAFWVYANFYTYFGDAGILQKQFTEEVSTFVIRKGANGSPLVAIWMTVSDKPPSSPVTFLIENFPEEQAQVVVMDNLLGTRTVENGYVETHTVMFSLKPQRYSSYCILIQQADSVFLPQVTR